MPRDDRPLEHVPREPLPRRDDRQPDRVLATFHRRQPDPLGRLQEGRLAIRTSGGARYVDLRIWTRSVAGWRPTDRGMPFSLTEAEQLARVLLAELETMRRAG